MTAQQAKVVVCNRARELGFDVCRIAPAIAPPHADALRRWLAEGRAGEMEWMTRNVDRRTDPNLVVPEARSAVVLAKSYSRGPSHEEMTRRPYQIARYAWGEDYHEVLVPRLRELEQILEDLGGRQRGYVDTGPVMERDFAALAGVGWQGKSTMLISENLGAFFFLGVILTTLELPPDDPVKDRCGRCVRCIEVCPTGAITAPRELDARRCVSYLTIELKGSIPEEFRPLVGNRIYGCDDCAAVCPWNRFATDSAEAKFFAREYVQGWALRDFLRLSVDEFREIFRHSPIKRIKRRGFLRNVCVALGNTGTNDDVPALKMAAIDPEPVIAEHARWALKQIAARA